MKVAYSLYELISKHQNPLSSTSHARQGALIKFTFSSDRIGYADCHTWPELGDLPLKQQLNLLARNEFTSITRNALEFAKIDSESRLQGKPVLNLNEYPQSHFLITHLQVLTIDHLQHISQQGYTHIKLKMGACLEQEENCLLSLFKHSDLKLRLDFNEKLDFKTFRNFLNRIQHLHQKIDFIEDPFPYRAEEWKTIQNDGWILACDRQIAQAYHKPEVAQVLIIKPALDPFNEWHNWKDQTPIVTSYLGHPLGQMAAAYVASQIDPKCGLVHGLLSHHVYQPNPFSQSLNWNSPQFTIPPGIGFGFGKELEEMEWVPLI